MRNASWIYAKFLDSFIGQLTTLYDLWKNIDVTIYLDKMLLVNLLEHEHTFILSAISKSIKMVCLSRDYIY